MCVLLLIALNFSKVEVEVVVMTSLDYFDCREKYRDRLFVWSVGLWQLVSV